MTIIFPTPDTPALVQGKLYTETQRGPLAKAKDVKKAFEKHYAKLRNSAIPFRVGDIARAKYLAYEISDGDPDTERFNAWIPDPKKFYAFDAVIAVNREGITKKGLRKSLVTYAWIKSETKEIDAILAAAAKAGEVDTITGNNEDGFLKITINGLPHLKINTSMVVGMQSWIDENQRDKDWAQYAPRYRTAYFIRFYLVGSKITMEYNDRGRWEKILKLVDIEIDWSILKKLRS